MATLLAGPIRQDDRFPVKLQVDCVSRDAFATGSATNLGRGGLFVVSERPLPTDAALELTLTLPVSGARVRALGRVVWNRERRQSAPLLTPGMGIKFLGMSSHDWKRLVEFLASLPAPDVMPLITSRRTAVHAPAPALS
jgi:type IV pilus assembly protein PilZ